jgi:hypothetical protein
VEYVNVIVDPDAAPVTLATGAATAVIPALETTAVVFGSAIVKAMPIVPAPCEVAVASKNTSNEIGVPAATGSVPLVATAFAEAVAFASTNETTVTKSAACAGTTDKSPNPSEATATADTFFNEIVFTIFLSFSQIKDDLLPGW